MSRWPNIFIVGAPKCGTSSMYDYLSQHPQVFGSEHKEPNFFNTDLQMADSMRVGGRLGHREAYLELYSDAGALPAVIEGSVWNLYSDVAPLAIAKEVPNAKIIVMLRNPVDFMYSSHGQRVRWFNEDILDFEMALDAESDRAAGRRIPKNCNKPFALQYRKTARFTQQVKQYMEVFGRGRVHIILFDDFITNTLDVYQDCLRFIGLNDSFEADFPVVNAAVERPRFFRLNHYLSGCRTGRVLQKSWLGVKLTAKRCVPQSCFEFVARAIRSVDNSPRRAPMSPSCRQTLIEEFRPEVEQLAELIGRDLSMWSEQPSATQFDKGARALPQRSKKIDTR